MGGFYTQLCNPCKIDDMSTVVDIVRRQIRFFENGSNECLTRLVDLTLLETAIDYSSAPFCCSAPTQVSELHPHIGSNAG